MEDFEIHQTQDSKLSILDSFLSRIIWEEKKTNVSNMRIKWNFKVFLDAIYRKIDAIG